MRVQPFLLTLLLLFFSHSSSEKGKANSLQWSFLFLIFQLKLQSVLKLFIDHIFFPGEHSNNLWEFFFVHFIQEISTEILPF